MVKIFNRNPIGPKINPKFWVIEKSNGPWTKGTNLSWFQWSKSNNPVSNKKLPRRNFWSKLPEGQKIFQPINQVKLNGLKFLNRKQLGKYQIGMKKYA